MGEMGEMGELEPSDPWTTAESRWLTGTGSTHADLPRRSRRQRASRRTDVDRERLSELCEVEPEMTPRLHQLWDMAQEDSMRLSERYTALARFWQDLEADEGIEDEYSAEIVGVALALRCTTGTADRLIRDAHLATEQLPETFSRLAGGEFPADWFDRLVRRTRHLGARDLAAVDAAVAAWPTTITSEQFRRRLSRLLTKLESQRETPPEQTPERRRRVELAPTGDDGVGCLQIIGPIPEILSLARRLDTSARAVQAAQRQALETGEDVPFDADGLVSGSGMPAPRARLQYDLLTGAALDTAGTRVPQERFRLNVTVPALTLLGASTEPGMLDGTTPVPADMARELAGTSETWYRVLTDPASGEFLPLPADRYRPTRAMLEHLRLRNATCAVPGCTRPSSWASEADHIEEYDHAVPTQGGLTEIENLHLLCWQHHGLKTAGLLDPVRLQRRPGELGATEWEINRRLRTVVRDDIDLATPATVRELTDSWDEYRRRQEAGRLVARHRRGRPPDPPPPPF